MADFKQELTALINRHSRENASDTPDFILAQYIEAALTAFEAATDARDRWWGLRPWDGERTSIHEPAAAPMGADGE